MSQTEIDKAKQAKKNCKTKLTKFHTFLEKCLTDRKCNIEEVKVRFKKMEEMWLEYDQAQLILEVVAPSANQETERVEFENSFYKYTAIASKIINEKSSEMVRGSISDTDSSARSGAQKRIGTRTIVRNIFVEKH